LFDFPVKQLLNIVHADFADIWRWWDDTASSQRHCCKYLSNSLI